MASDEEVRRELMRNINGLTAPQVGILNRMASAMRMPVETRINPTSDLVSERFSIAFSNELIIYHATHEQKLNKKTFEFLFKFASIEAGRSAEINKNSTEAAGDVIVDGVSFSLKTQADGAIRPGAIYIQKFMEARWIRECVERGDFCREASERILAHAGRYDRILVLRAFDGPRPGTFRYELVEIPKTLIGLIGRLTPDDFSERNKYGSSGADVRDGDGIAFRLLLDGSVEKVRIFNLRTNRCIFHGEWVVPALISEAPGGDD